MKKRFFCIFLAVLLCLALCGCGEVRNSTGRDNGAMDILPDASPMVSPDVNDGVVTDQDGIIGNGQGADNNGQTGNTVSPSPSPQTGAGMTGGSSTTTPTASPKP